MLIHKYLLIFTFLIVNLHLSAQNDYQVVLKTDFSGEVSEGSIETLIAEVRKGKPVRVGWQLDFNKDNEADFEHWADAGFITVLDGHVFAQLEGIYRQIPNMDLPQIEIVPHNMKWTGVIGTNGKLLNRWVMKELAYDIDEMGNPIITEAVEKGLKQREVKTWKVTTFWSVPK